MARHTIIKAWIIDGATVAFYPVHNIPGVSHRVVIQGLALDWLGDKFAPSGKVAAFFYEKHAAQVNQVSA